MANLPGLSLLALCTGLAACGGGREPQPPAPSPMPSRDAGRERTVPEDGGVPLDGSSAGEAGPDGATADGSAPSSGDGGAPTPTELAITALRPGGASRATELVLAVEGIGFSEGATILYDGQAVATTRQTAGRLTAALTPAHTEQAGFHTVAVTLGGASPPSPVAYFVVPPEPGWPEIVDVNPDNAEIGQKVRLVGFNITGEALRIADGAGQTASSGRIGTIAGNNQLLETAEFTVPAGWRSGPLVISTAVGTFRAKTFNVGKNLTTLPGTKVTASSEYGEEWTIPRGADNDIFTSWFTAEGDCVSRGPTVCTKTPWFMVSFAEPQTVARLALRGNREYTSGYDFLQGRFEVLGPDGKVLWSTSRLLPEPDRDLDLALPSPIAGAAAVRFQSERDESADPGFGELEIFRP